MKKKSPMSKVFLFSMVAIVGSVWMSVSANPLVAPQSASPVSLTQELDTLALKMEMFSGFDGAISVAQDSFNHGDISKCELHTIAVELASMFSMNDFPAEGQSFESWVKQHVGAASFAALTLNYLDHSVERGFNPTLFTEFAELQSKVDSQITASMQYIDFDSVACSRKKNDRCCDSQPLGQECVKKDRKNCKINENTNACTRNSDPC